MLSDFWKRIWSGQGGAGQVLRVALPLIISTSFWTLQMTIDRILLSRYDSDSVGAAQIAVLVFWTVYSLLHTTAQYSSTFVAQYLGAKQPHRVGPVMWQTLYFSLGSGVLFWLVMWFSADGIVSLAGHSGRIQEMETTYLKCLTFAALPMALVATASGFFMGREQTAVVMVINALGLVVNAGLDYVLIYGYWGFPEMGIAGAGWATVISSCAAAALALVLMFRPRYQAEYQLFSSWRFEAPLFGRLLRFGLPSGLQWALDGLAFVIFSFFIGKMGEAELSANSIAFAINLLAFLPPMGIGQAVAVLVGQRLGENRPELAARSTWTGFGVAWIYMTVMGLSFVIFPDMYIALFQTQGEPEKWSQVAAIVPTLLCFAAVFCLFDSMNMVFSFALKGAGDTRFVSIISLALAWTFVVPPTVLAWYWDWGIYWAWAFVTLYVISLAFVLLVRFCQGKWKSMRVIEMPVDPALETSDASQEPELIPEPALGVGG